jgi:hypothetical protein
MPRLAFLPLAMTLVACRPAAPPAVAPSPALTAQPEAAVLPPITPDAAEPGEAPEESRVADAGPPGCAEANRLAPVDLESADLDHEVEFELPERSDDITEYTASGKSTSELPPHVTDKERTYSLEGETNDLVAHDGPKLAWRAPGFEVAGGIFFVSLSPAGHVVARTYSRGSTELFEARTGRRYAEGVGPHVIFDPNDRYALDLPALQAWTTNAYDRAEVHKISFASVPATVRSPVRLPIDVGKEVEFDDKREFGAAICATGALYVVSHPDGELALYRAKDDAKLARVAHPPSGYPAFTWSGKFVYVRHAPMSSDDPGPSVVAVYRLESAGPSRR